MIEIECLDTQSTTQAKDRLIHWLETFGHTSVSHGFEFNRVGKVQFFTEAVEVETKL